MNTVTLKNTKSQILAAFEAMRDVADRERTARRSLEDEIKLLRAKVYAAPDKYCVTTPDGNCISEDPRCMHNTPAPKSQEPSCEAPSAKPMTIKEFCAEYCRVHGTRSVPGAVVKAWRASFKCTCGKCGGTGEYGNLGICYACQGTGEQTVQDVERNSTYWKLNG